MLNDVKKIAVLRANALGDFILTLPALEALKKTYHHSELVLLGRQSHSELYQDRTWPIDRIIPLPSFIQFNETLRDWSLEKNEFIKVLKAEDFDLLVQLHGGGKYSNLFAKLIGAKLLIGSKSSDAPRLDINVPYVQHQHEILRQLEIVKKAGASHFSLNPTLTVLKSDLSAAFSLLSRLKISRHTSFIVLNPGATDPKRRWPAWKFSLISDYLTEKGFKILINLAPGEDKLASKIKKYLRFQDNVFLLTPTLKELSGLLALSKLVISNDTGTMHLAMALKKPTISLFWFKNLLHYGPVFSGSNKVLISWETSCPECGTNCCDHACFHESSLISSISSKSVMKAMDELLNLKSKEYA